MFRICKIWLTLHLFLFLSGCWDEKTIQDFHYITAIGIDFKDGEYIVYTQLVDFAAVAKTEAKADASSSRICRETKRTVDFDRH
ncbi:hypothetical protein ACJEBK_06925 [Peribacillus frigoritolerans]|uniref:Ger(x)C family spore germination protein n=1 Tax=Peribacillus TaxID=2675229 RepID=UPI000BA5ABF1|nr:hypothetical protein [Peribacillus simplex]PAL11924.1 hypothetical protein B8W99_13950 [Peribacillus simplex]